jgi:cell surface protein SprA
MKIKLILLYLGIFLVIGNVIARTTPISRNLADPYQTQLSIRTDTVPVKDRIGDFITDKSYNPFELNTKEVEQKVEYDAKTNQYVLYEKVGGHFVRTPTYLTFEEYLDYKAKEQEKRYFNTLAGIKSDKKSRLGRINPMDKIDLGTSLVDRLFGGTEVNIQPQGTVDVSIGWLYSKSLRPTGGNGRQVQSQPDFPTPVIKMNVDGKIGKKLDLDFNYDTQSTFDFDKVIKLGFDSQSFSEDDIIKKIEAGNVSLPLRGNLIQGAQSLFGLKTELQFGRLRVTALASQQKSKSNNLKIENGEAIEEFTVNAVEYDENKHFFLSHYNRNNYEKALANLPFINTSHQVAQIEVWISDDRLEYQENTSMIAAISDLAEPDTTKFSSSTAMITLNTSLKDENNIPLPRNNANNIYERVEVRKDIEDIDKISDILSLEFGMQRSRDFEVFRGRKLSSSEYTYHPKLGTISLNSRLKPNQVLGVAYNYFYTTICDTTFQVGMIASSSVQSANQTDTTRIEPPKVHFVKLLKSTNQTPRITNGNMKNVKSPMWDLMMKNAYSVRSSQLNPKDFIFDIYYEDDFADGSVKKYIPEPGLKNVPILQLVNLDKLNRYNDPQPDGYFDYIPGVTIIEKSGSIILPLLEPFGNNLNLDKFKSIDQGATVDQAVLDSKYKYTDIYESTITVARLAIEKNKFSMRGKVKSSGNNGEYSLGPFVPQGSVRVTAGGRNLIENQDYEIDYGAGRLRVINEAYLQTGTPINISFEDNSGFGFQQKNMLGLRAEYQFNKKSSLGFNYIKVYERPYTLKVNILDDPIKNRMLGFDYNLDHELPWLTKALDKLPFYSTAEKSKINLTSEVALLLPDHANGINTPFDKTGIANLDDFEGAVNNFPLAGLSTFNWVLASTPLNLKTNEGRGSANDLKINANRARLNWYSLDFSIPRSQADNDDPYTSQVNQNLFFPKKETQPGQNAAFTFDLSFFPSERGPYNFDNRSGTSSSAGFDVVNDSIVLKKPEERWGGIMRYFPNSDFEAANYESIEFWMMNPFEDRRDGTHDPNESGEIVFNLGNISEDIMKDNLLFFENAIPTSQRRIPTKDTPFGRATVSIPLVSGFDLTDGKSQDIGFDALDDEAERKKFGAWMTSNQLNSLTSVNQDPSNDNFLGFNDPLLNNENNILNRMRKFNGPEGNTPINNNTNSNSNQRVQGNIYPDSEDLNNNKTLDQTESFYEYRLPIKNNNGELDLDALGTYYRDSKLVPVNGTAGKMVRWYRIQIPVAGGTPINGITGFRSIQYMRMYMTDFTKPKTFRLLSFQMQRSQWRKLPITDCGDATNSLNFVLDDVGVEENSNKEPFNYVEPVERTAVTSNFGTFRQDEKSMVLKFNKLPPTCEVKMNKLVSYNLALYKRLLHKRWRSICIRAPRQGLCK